MAFRRVFVREWRRVSVRQVVYQCLMMISIVHDYDVDIIQGRKSVVSSTCF